MVMTFYAYKMQSTLQYKTLVGSIRYLNFLTSVLEFSVMQEHNPKDCICGDLQGHLPSQLFLSSY